jgi:hypothetical protein
VIFLVAVEQLYVFTHVRSSLGRLLIFRVEEIWWIAGNGGLLNKQSHVTGERLGRGLTLVHCEEPGMLLNVTHNLELGHVASIE